MDILDRLGPLDAIDSDYHITLHCQRINYHHPVTILIDYSYSLSQNIIYLKHSNCAISTLSTCATSLF
jgi:hypothetical protein